MKKSKEKKKGSRKTQATKPNMNDILNGSFCQEPKEKKTREKAKKAFRLPKGLTRINATEAQIYGAIAKETERHGAYAIGIKNEMLIKRNGKPLQRRAIYKAISSLIAKGYIIRTKTKEYITPYDLNGKRNAEAIDLIEKRKAESLEKERRRTKQEKKRSTAEAERLRQETAENIERINIAQMIISNNFEKIRAIREFARLKPLEKIERNQRYMPNSLMIWSDTENKYVGYRKSMQITAEIKEKMLKALNTNYLTSEEIAKMQLEKALTSRTQSISL